MINSVAQANFNKTYAPKTQPQNNYEVGFQGMPKGTDIVQFAKKAATNDTVTSVGGVLATIASIPLIATIFNIFEKLGR